MKLNKDTFEVIFFARGGQGAKTAAEILARAAISEGKYATAFPEFGPERSGAPIRTFLRVSEKEIRTQETIHDPDLVVVLDETVMKNKKVTDHLDRDETLIINTKKTKDEVKKIIPEFLGSVQAIDASGLALEITGRPNSNTVILGALVKVTELVKIETAKQVFREIFEEKLGKDLVEKNMQAIQKAYDNI